MSEREEINYLKAELEYERSQRYAAELALHTEQEMRRSGRPEQFAQCDWENDEWPR